MDGEGMRKERGGDLLGGRANSETTEEYDYVCCW